MPEHQTSDVVWARPTETPVTGLSQSHPGGRWQSSESVEHPKSGTGKPKIGEPKNGSGDPENGTERPLEDTERPLEDPERVTGDPERKTKKPERANEMDDTAFSFNAKTSKKLEA